jgi:hypothetical protein
VQAAAAAAGKIFCIRKPLFIQFTFAFAQQTVSDQCSAASVFIDN